METVTKDQLLGTAARESEPGNWQAIDHEWGDRFAEATLEIRGERKPGLVAETITMFVFEKS